MKTKQTKPAQQLAGKYVKEYWKNFNERYKTLTAEELIALYHTILKGEATRQCLFTLMNVKNVIESKTIISQ